MDLFRGGAGDQGGDGPRMDPETPRETRVRADVEGVVVDGEGETLPDRRE